MLYDGEFVREILQTCVLRMLIDEAESKELALCVCKEMG